ncbi:MULTISPECIES: hypothetical protein [Rhodopseudomonas]|uniref:Transmembrane protein n=1 Tax=Rhodopseudomonas palustris TaxID=1076 RepID=A0A0D7E319_RHOPL|nr:MULTISPECIES: hypothetical protein [Rhodopseudomonas]KIZ34007.1 hypothetical protein OO17_27545 [Rhodopseudomonas palustris]MDF3810279.1 hypothetical protein [Rhodopseudomonas sp. BAL398]WOK17129.1 hypothetical protein RBJ75_23875 [Rhodopseudomonas sp. BAL398]
MDADQGAAGVGHLTAGEVLDGIREQLQQPGTDDLQLLLKISQELADLDDRRLSPEAASAWNQRAETKREKARASLGLQTGVKRGLLIGFITGFVLCALFAAALAMHWLVVMQ